VFVVDMPGATQTSLALAQPGVSVTDPDATALRVLNAVLGGNFNSRINLNLRERHGYTYGASSNLDLGRAVGLLTLQSNVSTEYTAASIRELLDEVAAMRDAPVAAEELARAKDSLSLSLPAGFTTGSSTAAAVGELYLADLPPDYYQNLPAAIAQVDAQDVQAAARAHLRPEEMKVVAVGDAAQIDPQLAELALGAVAYRNPDGTPAATG
jgi:predicted Zn-dependent peptidase